MNIGADMAADAGGGAAEAMGFDVLDLGGGWLVFAPGEMDGGNGGEDGGFMGESDDDAEEDANGAGEVRRSRGGGGVSCTGRLGG